MVYTTILADPDPPLTLFETAPISAPIAGTQLVSTLQWNNLIAILDGTSLEKIPSSALEDTFLTNPMTADLGGNGFDILDIDLGQFVNLGLDGGFMNVVNPSYIYFTDNSSLASSVGRIRLADNHSIGWRNVADTENNFVFFSSDLLIIQHDTVTQYSFSSSESDWLGNNLVNFGYLESNAAIPSTVGTIRLGNNQSISWRNFVNNQDFSLKLNVSNEFEFDNPINVSAINGLADIYPNPSTLTVNGSMNLGGDLSIGGFTLFNVLNMYFTDFIEHEGDPAVSGVIRLNNNDVIAWRNAGSTADLGFVFNASDLLVFNSTTETFGANIITNHGTVVPVAGDFILFHDATDGTIKKANASNFLAGGSQTPWTSDIDADGFDLNDLSNILFRDTTGAPTSTDRSIWYADSTGMEFNALTGDVFNLRINAVIEYAFSATIFDVLGNSIDNVTSLTSNAGTPASAGVIRLGNAEFISWDLIGTGDGDLSIDANDDLIFRINGTTELQMSDSLMDLKTNILQNSRNNVATYSSNQTLVDTEEVILINPSTSAMTITLPAASGRTGKHYKIIYISTTGMPVTIDGNASETINTKLTVLIENYGDILDIYSDGSNWYGEFKRDITDPLTCYYNFCDFETVGTLTTCSMNNGNWRLTGTGTETSANLDGIIGHVGQCRFGTSAASGDDIDVFQGNTAGNAPWDADENWTMTMMLRIDNTLANATYRFGLSASCLSSSAETTENALFLFDTATSAKWRMRTRSAGGTNETTTDGGADVVLNQWYKLKIVRDGSTIRFYIDNVNVANHSTQVPTTAISPYLNCDITSAALRTFNVDYTEMFVRNIAR